MQTSTDPQVLDTQYVQFFLDNLPPMQKFTVIFKKVDGTQRKISGYLDPNNHSRKNAVPVMTEDGWRSFKIDRVLFVDKIHSDTLDNEW